MSLNNNNTTATSIDIKWNVLYNIDINFYERIETYIGFKVCKMFKAKQRKNGVNENIAYMFIDEDSNQGYTVVKENKFYKVPASNENFWFPEDYNNGKITGRFQKFVCKNKKFFALYKSSSDGADFMVNKKLKIVK